METFTIEHLTFFYPDTKKPALSDLSLTVKQGEFVTLCGKSGCGKSTLLRHLKSVLTPHGARSGTILFEGTPLDTIDQRTQTAKIGYVLQSPENQIVTDKVWHELAFGLESLGCPTPEIRLRVAEMASFFGIQTWFHKSVTDLSGGQKQLLNLASVMAMQPSVLILDEPTSQLDPIAATDFLETLQRINRELGTTILISEHRLEEVLPMSDRVVVIDGGKILEADAPRAVGARLKERGHDMFLSMPTPMRIYAGVENTLDCPVTVREGRSWLDEFSQMRKLSPEMIVDSVSDFTKSRNAVELREVCFKYEKDAPDVVRQLSMTVKEGELFAIVGGNGTGKTTTLSLISGILKPYRGKVSLFGRALDKISDKERFDGLLGVLPQNPQALFVKKTVEQDLYEMFSGRHLPKEEQAQRIGDISALCELDNLLSMHPYDLSGGEQQRAALAKVLLLEPEILLLDEPTKGLDSHFKQKLAGILKQLQMGGTTVIMVSHDVEYCAQYADRCAMFFDGNIVTEGTPRAFFSGNSFYTTAANRMARHALPQAVTAEDVISACGGAAPKPPDKPPFKPTKKKASSPPPKPEDFFLQTPVEKRKLSKRTLTAALMILIAIPLTIWFGIYYLDDRKYYFISLMVILETMLPFAMIFEGRKPQARELVVIAVLCAIAVTGRIAFFMVPQFKPVVALVILAGVCFGGEAGFMVGAVSGFVSNFFFGQSPLTPWQMFSFGIIGFLAGVLFRKGLLRRTTPALCIFGGLATFLIYGGLMNPASVLTAQGQPTAEMFFLAYLQGIPFDLIHAASTVIFLLVIAKPMLEKMDRIKMKYGLIE